MPTFREIKGGGCACGGQDLEDKSTLARYAFLTCKKARKLVEYRDETSSQRIPASCLGWRRALNVITHRSG
jgi:hypothetical protein